jgi:multicomponent K+:H+ antiporter subunit E
MMARWLPYPLVAAALAGVWLLLNETVSPGAILLGAVAAVAASRVLVRLDMPRIRPRRLLAIVRLTGIVLVEIVRSNNAVARIILGRRKGRTSGFVRIPLDMRNPYGLCALACIITATPGTVWVEYDSTDSWVLIHVLDLVDEEVWVRIIKQRYEARLMEIFE